MAKWGTLFSANLTQKASCYIDAPQRRTVRYKFQYCPPKLFLIWKIEFDPTAERDFNKLDQQIIRRILVFLRDRVASLDDPRSIGEALKGARLGEFWKYRVDDWRIIVNIEDDILRILIIRVGNWREVYRR